MEKQRKLYWQADPALLPAWRCLILCLFLLVVLAIVRSDIPLGGVLVLALPILLLMIQTWRRLVGELRVLGCESDGDGQVLILANGRRVSARLLSAHVLPALQTSVWLDARGRRHYVSQFVTDDSAGHGRDLRLLLLSAATLRREHGVHGLR